MAKEVEYETRSSAQKQKKDDKEKKAKDEIKKVLDNDLLDALEDSDSHETKVELLLLQIARNTAN